MNNPRRHEKDEAPAASGRQHRRLIPLTIAEIRRLLNLPRRDDQALDHGLYWSAWRRQHQADARWHHFRRRLRLQTLQI
jgi:hypothetical protein